MRQVVHRCIGALCLVLYIIAPITAMAASPTDDVTGTLLKIRDKGVVTIGYRESSIPFSYLDDKARPVGYTIALCGRIVDALKTRLNRPALAVDFQAVTSGNRIPLVQNGTIDLECGSTVNNAERQALVGFSLTTFVVSTRFMARQGDHLKTLDDLKGKVVAVTTGTNTARRVRELDAQRQLGLTLVNGKDHADSMLLLSSGRASAFFEDDILLTGLAASSRAANDFSLGSEGFSADPYAIMFAKGDADFKALVDGVLAALYQSGEIDALYDRWFMQPIPPRNIALGFPMGAALRKAIAAPTDSPDPARYR